MSQPLSVQGRRLSRMLCLAALGIGIQSMPVVADVVILKDGYTIHGKLITQQTSFFDNLTGELIVTKKMNGLTMVDDGVRLTAFSANYKRVGDVDPFDKFVDLVQIKNPEPRRDIPLSVTIAYFFPKPGGDQGNLWVAESAEPERPSPLPSSGEVWREVEGLKVGTDDSTGYLRCKVLLEREGTYIHLESTAMAVHELIGLARSLVLLAPETPPKLGTT